MGGLKDLSSKNPNFSHGSIVDYLFENLDVKLIEIIEPNQSNGFSTQQFRNFIFEKKQLKVSPL